MRHRRRRLPDCGSDFEELPKLRTDAQPRGFTIWSKLLAMVNKQPVLPVDILSGEFRRIGLSRACFV
jgi:hypothetical protein